MSNEILIGAQLREARLNKNITIDELQQKTKIQKRYLEALEEGAFDRLPGTYYVRSFIRQYATVVELDGDKLVSIFDGKADFGPTLPKRPQPEHVQGSRKAQHVAEKQQKVWIDYLPVILLALIALTVLSVVFYISWSNRTSKPMITQNESSISVNNQVSSVSSSSQESTTQTSTTISSSEKKQEMKIERTQSTQSQAMMTVTNATNPIELSFTGKDGRCWVGVLVNNAYVYQNTFESGATASFTLPEGTTNATIVLGASAYIDIKANSKTLDFDDPQYSLLKKNVVLAISYLN